MMPSITPAPPSVEIWQSAALDSMDNAPPPFEALLAMLPAVSQLPTSAPAEAEPQLEPVEAEAIEAATRMCDLLLGVAPPPPVPTPVLPLAPERAAAGPPEPTSSHLRLKLPVADASASTTIIFPEKAAVSEVAHRQLLHSGPVILDLDAIKALGAPKVGFVELQLDLARDGRWLDQLANDIAAAATGDDQLSFRLVPERLGKLDVDLSRSETGMSVRMSASTDEARSVISAAQPRLVEELRSQGIRVAETQVDTGDRRQQNRATRAPPPLVEISLTQTGDVQTPVERRPTGRFA
jgi:flagellar hook-length control protein FliK